jgi:hypothetical protein
MRVSSPGCRRYINKTPLEWGAVVVVVEIKICD